MMTSPTQVAWISGSSGFAGSAGVVGTPRAPLLTSFGAAGWMARDDEPFPFVAGVPWAP